LSLSAQHDVWQLPGGMSIIAVGADYQWNKYTQGYSPYGLVNSGYSTQDSFTSTAIGGPGGAVPLDASRNNWGLYAELLLPVLKTLEITGSVRYDYYDKIKSNYVFSTTADANGVFQQIANADLGNTFNDTTYKVSARWTPIEHVLVRGSYGTGFKAPAFADIAGPLIFNGSTANSYACPFPGTSGCIAGSAQYDLLAGPNGLSGSAGLKPEKSTQWTVGGRWDPLKGVTMGADFWDVKIRDQILSQGIAEQVAFANPQQYAGLFINPYVDPIGGFNTIGLQQIPFNGGTAEYQGLDWDVGYRTDAPWGWGVFSAALSGSQIFKAKYTFGPGQPFLSSLGQYGPDQQVVFRTTMQLIMNLATGPWNNNITGHYKSGYDDQSYLGGSPQNIFFQNPDGSLGKSAPSFDRLHVASYLTWDYQLAYASAKGSAMNVIDMPWKFIFGITNFTDRKPPFSLQSGGGGNQVGYDGRYADPIGRAYYVRGEIRF
jgi:iron complex outermembrane receptor protein